MPDGQAPSDPRMTHWRRPKTLASQLELLGVKPADIKFLPLIQTTSAMWKCSRKMLLVQKAEYEWPNPLGVGRFKPEHPVSKLEGDHDVFGDVVLQFWQFHQQRLVAGRVAGRRQNCHATIAEYVVVTFEFAHRMFRLEAPDAERVRPLVFCLLHQQHCLREHFHIADVVWMSMGPRRDI